LERFCAGLVVGHAVFSPGLKPQFLEPIYVRAEARTS
jgi:hypothetical protein